MTYESNLNIHHWSGEHHTAVHLREIRYDVFNMTEYFYSYIFYSWLLIFLESISLNFPSCKKIFRLNIYLELIKLSSNQVVISYATRRDDCVISKQINAHTNNSSILMHWDWSPRAVSDTHKARGCLQYLPP